MYSLKMKDSEKNTAKAIIRRELKHHLYKNCLFGESLNGSKLSMHLIQSRQHQLYTVNVSKIGLSPFDDKCYVLEDGIHAHAHGQYLNVENQHLKQNMTSIRVLVTYLHFLM